MSWTFCDFIDPDPDGFRIDQILWVRIRIQSIRIHITGNLCEKNRFLFQQRTKVGTAFCIEMWNTFRTSKQIRKKGKQEKIVKKWKKEHFFKG